MWSFSCQTINVKNYPCFLRALPTSGNWADLPAWILASPEVIHTGRIMASSPERNSSRPMLDRWVALRASAGLTSAITLTQLCPIGHRWPLSRAWRLHSVHTGKAESSMTSSEPTHLSPRTNPTAGSTVELCSVDLKARLQSIQLPGQKGAPQR